MLPYPVGNQYSARSPNSQLVCPCQAYGSVDQSPSGVASPTQTPGHQSPGHAALLHARYLALALRSHVHAQTLSLQMWTSIRGLQSTKSFASCPAQCPAEACSTRRPGMGSVRSRQTWSTDPLCLVGYLTSN